MASANVYSFSSQPQAVSGRRAKYRDPGIDGEAIYRDLRETNISWDRRVHRGNTYSIHTRTAAADAYAATGESVPKTAPRKRLRPKEASPFDMGLPEADRIPVDLVNHLVEKVHVVEVDANEAQTDEFMPEPPPAQYLPQRTGVDVSTQILDGELFSFDEEVEPLLEVIVNKTLEQSLMEVSEEEEMKAMAEFKVEWFNQQDLRAKDVAEQIGEEQQRWAVKEEVMERQRARKRREAEVLLKVQAMAAAKAHLAGLVPGAVRGLTKVTFPDARLLAVERIFLPQLLGEVHEQVRSITQAQEVFTDIANEGVKEQLKAMQASRAKQREVFKEMERKRREEAQIRRGSIRIYVPDSDGNRVPVGPVQISSDEDIGTVQDRVFAWLQENEPELSKAWEFGILLCLDDEPAETTAAIFAAKAGQISLQPKPEPIPEEPEDNGEEGEGEGEEGAEA